MFILLPAKVTTKEEVNQIKPLTTEVATSNEPPVESDKKSSDLGAIQEPRAAAVAAEATPNAEKVSRKSSLKYSSSIGSASVASSSSVSEGANQKDSESRDFISEQSFSIAGKLLCVW